MPQTLDILLTLFRNGIRGATAFTQEMQFYPALSSLICHWSLKADIENSQNVGLRNTQRSAFLYSLQKIF